MIFDIKIKQALLIVLLVWSAVCLLFYIKMFEDMDCRKYKELTLMSIQQDFNKTHIHSMHVREKMAHKRHFTREKHVTLLTLFTSWKNSKEKDIVIRNTIQNWQYFHPNVLAVVFANSIERSHRYALKHGWTVQKPKTATDENIPILRDMFQKAINHSPSAFYGYANSDILFTPLLLKTLMKVKGFQEKTKKPVLVVGQRKDISIVNISSAMNFLYILQQGLRNGKLQGPDAIDYCIISPDFPISNLPDVVIGRIAYDNYVIMHARAYMVAVVDVTLTNPVIHQSTGAGSFEGHNHNNKLYNKELLKRLLQITTFDSGSTTCSNYVTLFNASTHEINLFRKSSKPEYCVRMFDSW